MLGQHEVLAAHQALCNSQGNQQPRQPGTATSGTRAGSAHACTHYKMFC